MKPREQKEAARQFAADWANYTYEKGGGQSFWRSLLHKVYGVEDPEKFIHFEDPITVDGTPRYIDALIPSTKVMIEHKSGHIDLGKPGKQSGMKQKLTPFQQARNYVNGLPREEHPKWIVVCNFKEFHIHDMERPNNPPEIVLLENLPKEVHRLQFLVDTGSTHIQEELPVSKKAGNLVGEIYDKLLAQYGECITDDDFRSANVLCVRLVFCLYAEDADVFDKQDQFHDYLAMYPASELRDALVRLFAILNTPYEKRSKHERQELLDFPYVNGGLFADGDEINEIPQFTEELRTLILDKASYGFNWSEISPTIFGAVFESTLNPETRRNGGMHYTSITNIHKVIGPLFLDDLKEELQIIKSEPNLKKRDKKLVEYQKKLSEVTCLDPACGSGNFLTETYLSLRRIENEVIKLLYRNQSMIGEFRNPIQVGINQFYGIEINDFAVSVATTAMWIAESQMRKETELIVKLPDEFLPLTSNTGVKQGNALRMDWNDVVKADKLKYIFGNPPFVGARKKNDIQKRDVDLIFGKKWKGKGDLDYVCCWFKKSANFMKGTDIRAALVSTNSISQGIHVSALWEPLTKNGLKIDFAYKSFVWDNEAKVHCVIEGFSYGDYPKHPVIYNESGCPIKANHINAYLLDMEDVFVGRRKKSLCFSSEIGIGNKPVDDNNYLFCQKEKEEFVKLEPRSEKYFHLWYGADEFINQSPRYCLWLGECLPLQLQSMPHCMKRIEAVREYRSKSSDKGTRKLADKPTRFHVENMFKGNYLVIPKTFSEKRDYVTTGFVKHKSLCGDALFIVREPSWYDFAILTSSIHKVWTQYIGGRLEMRFRYSKDLVYNNFPLPDISKGNRLMAFIEESAFDIHKLRESYFEKGETYKSLYEPNTMPEDLRQAHHKLDKAVLKAYGLPANASEMEIITLLLRRFKELSTK